ncbi:MAG TPA: RecX family transcriptional regulator [Chloroflexota bacterium]
MPVITSLFTQKNDPERVNVYLDGHFAFGISALSAAVHRLHEGRELDEAEVEALGQEDAVDRAHNAALNYLSFRPRSKREMEDYFRRRKVDSDTVASVLERLERAGLVDDGEFARFWVENRQTFRPRGTRALRMELRQKGVQSETIEATVESIGDETEIALQAARQKLRSFAHLDDRTFQQKMIGFLQRRGFPYGVSAHVARDLVVERGGADDDLTGAPIEED